MNQMKWAVSVSSNYSEDASDGRDDSSPPHQNTTLTLLEKVIYMATSAHDGSITVGHCHSADDRFQEKQGS